MLRVEDIDRVRVCTLDRPEARNAFNDNLYDALREAMTGASADPDIAALLITHTGPVFSAGQDLRDMATRKTREEYETRGFRPLTTKLLEFDKPLLAAVDGAGVGIGLTMLLHCDLVFVSEAARFRTPFVSLGIGPELGSTVLLPQRIGPQAAARMLFTAEWLSAQEAVDFGLATGPFPQGKVFEEALAVARTIAAMPVSSLVATKRLILEARTPAASAARQREEEALKGLVGGPANLEAIRAFAEKRPPDFTRLPA